MGRRRFVWLLALPLAAVGWLGGHSLAYLLVAPHSAHRHALLAEAGHGYLGGAPLLVACAIALLLVGIGLAVHDALRGRARSRVAIWPVALVPPVGFAVQEHLERLIERNAFPAEAALEPTFLVGMALQLALAVIAVLIARAILVLGHTLGRRLALPESPRVRPATVPVLLPRPLEPDLLRTAILATGHGERAPPFRARS